MYAWMFGRKTSATHGLSVKMRQYGTQASLVSGAFWVVQGQSIRLFT